MSTTAPYGSWSSPIDSAALVEQVVGLGCPEVDGDTLYWLEARPSQGGRQVVVRRAPGQPDEDVIPAEFSARSLVHEYGGLPYAVQRGVVYFVNLLDQRLYRIDPGRAPVAITDEAAVVRAHRHVAPVLTPDGRALFCVRERHEPGGSEYVYNEIVRVATDGSGTEIVADGHDFVSSPTVSPDGRRLAWISWDHPDMPWDATELWAAGLESTGRVTSSRRVAGGRAESVVQPRFAPDGRLHFVSDRSGWWNIYVEEAPGSVREVAPIHAEIAGPDWQMGNSSYVFSPEGEITARWSADGFAHVGTVEPGPAEPRTAEPGSGEPSDGPGHLVETTTPFIVIEDLRPVPGGVVAVAGSGTKPPALVRISVDGAVEELVASRAVTVDAGYLSEPRAITFSTVLPGNEELPGSEDPSGNEDPSGAGDQAGGSAGGAGPNALAHAFYYPPCNPDFTAPAGELPPLIVQSHGGPTSHTVPVLNFRTQYWTSRGFAVVDVDYGGSTGYGRAYRERLRGNWGIVDVEDCVRAALHLADEGLADPDRLLIHGGSAGGFTTLAAVTFRDTFAAGASYYGVADAAALARDTHKFESRYLDSLIGPWPEAEELYEERSPIHHVDRLRTPLILFQGMEDAIVPPNQTEAMANALDRNGVPYAAIYYPDEQHGFRDARNIRRTAEAELAFYGLVLGFTPADEIAPLEVENLGALAGDPG